MRTRSYSPAAPRSRAWGVLVAGLTLASGAASTLLGVEPAGAAAYSGDQWGLGVIGAPTAWQYGNGSGVRIGIVDTGVDLQQQDLSGKVVAQGYFVSSPSSQCEQSAPAQNPAADDNGHGTHVAGIAAAKGIGVSGVAPGASLVVAKVLDCTGSGLSQDVVNGIDWAVANGARVINLSLGNAAVAGIDTSQIQGSPLGAALQNAWNAGAIPVVAGGNNGGGPAGLGNANYAGVPAVIVAATGSPSNGETDQLACYSNQIDQAQWGVAAPGGDDPNTCALLGNLPAPSCGQFDPYEILSTYWMSQPPKGYDATNCYASDEGTSMATPFVSGALALLLGRGLSPTQAVQTLLNTANHGVACGSVCSGLVDIGAAMQSAATPHPATSGASPTSPGAPTSGAHGSAASSAGLGTTTAPASTSTSPAPTTSTSPSEKSQRTLGLRDKGASASGGSAWWLVLPVLVGLAAAGTLGYFGRRRLTLQHARVRASDPDPPGAPPPL